MSGNIVTINHSEKFGHYLQWGRETFYNERREMRAWTKEEDAKQWLAANHPELTLVEKAREN